jgi:hypothetical protein
MTQIVPAWVCSLSQLVTESGWDRKTFEKINGQDARWPTGKTYVLLVAGIASA